MNIWCLGLLLCALASQLTGCRYIMLPLVPAERTSTSTFGSQLNPDAAIVLDQDRLKLALTVSGAARGYVAVRWYAQGKLLGTDASYLDEQQRGVVFWQAYQVQPVQRYRAVILFNNAIVRQLDYVPEGLSEAQDVY